MTGDDPAAESREADLAVASAAPETVAAAVAPDDTDDVQTRADRDPDRALPDWADGVVRVHVTRESTGGLQATVDDSVVNLTVAETVVETAREHATDNTPTEHDT
ncbi:MAG: KEOPS complex subunit Pcc1 [Halolamina sp.]